MNFVDLIIKKRNKEELTKEEIKYFIKGVTNNTIPDYQISSMLMAIYLNSLTYNETAILTSEMADSGEIIDLSSINSIKVDKHSTGGVSDTTTLILTPLVASCGLPIIKMSGKGLGHTGGTIDKLESIPNFNTNISYQKAIDIVKQHGIALISQTSNLVPADKKLYSLRDVTGTVESIPLIASSIMSKKIASGSDSIVLDVKCGNGAFMKTFSASKELAETMVKIGESLNKKVVSVITDMNEPLGMNIGNTFEVIEAIEVLKGNIDGNLKEVALTLGGYMLTLGGISNNIKEAKQMLNENIKNKKGLNKLTEVIEAQGGNSKIIDNYSLLPHSNCKVELTAHKSGYIYSMDTYSIGKASVEAGAGRLKKDDIIDYGAGIILKVKIGDKVNKNDLLAEIYSSSKEKCNCAIQILKSAIEIRNTEPNKKNIILDIIGDDK